MAEELGSIIPEFGSRPEDIEELNAAISMLAWHNAQNSPEMLVRHLLGIEAELPAEPDWSLNASRPLAETQSTSQGALSGSSLAAVRSAGLSLGEPHDRIIVRHGAYDGLKADDIIHVQLEDGEQFCAFLDHAKEQENADPDFEETLRTITAHLLQDVSDHLTTEREIPTAANTIAYAGAIADKLEAFEFGDSFNSAFLPELRECQQHATTGTLSEWAIASKLFLLDTVDQQTSRRAGPAVWHRRRSPADALRQWQTVLSVLDMARNNPTGQEFFATLFEAARASFEHAHRDWLTSRSNPQRGSGGDRDTQLEALFNLVGWHLR